ncbi:MAG: hypothetical protein V4501_01815 [Pseudomonadota bacterium]
MLSADLRKLPITPAETLQSRRTRMYGDVILFPLEENTSSSTAVSTIKQAQQVIYQLIENDLNIVGKTWDSATSRHQQKFFKRHKKLHLSFLSTIPPSTLADFAEQKASHTNEQIQQTNEELTNLINQPDEMRGIVKECKLNPDGHIVVRVEILTANGMLSCKEKISKIFGATYNRYHDPEKQKTLATVIAVVDHEKLSNYAKEHLTTILNQLTTALKEIGPIPLQAIEWIEYNKRTISPHSHLAEPRKFIRV